MKKFNSSILIILILFFALAGFYLIYVNNPSMSGEQSFFNNLINSLMGAMVVALVTASIFIFQSRIEGDKEKEKYIFQKKLELYQNLARTISRINNDGKITKISLDELKSFKLEIDLLADKDLVDLYPQFINSESFKETKKNESISEEFDSFTIDIIGLSRKELDVLKSIPLEKRNQLEVVIQKQKKIYRTPLQMFNIVKDYGYGVADLDSKYEINKVQNRVQDFRKQLIKKDHWKMELEKEGISTDPEKPIIKGSLKKKG